jgi:hypothetical protein
MLRKGRLVPRQNLNNIVLNLVGKRRETKIWAR